MGQAFGVSGNYRSETRIPNKIAGNIGAAGMYQLLIGLIGSFNQNQYFRIGLEQIFSGKAPKRTLVIYFVHNCPRQGKKGDFINKYFGSREVVNAIKKKYGPGVEVDVLVKDFDGKDKLYFRNVDLIDNYVPEKYTQDDLEKKL